MSAKYILSLDQGTTSSRALLFDDELNHVATAQKEFQQIYPNAGWVEHDPNEIWKSQIEVAKEVLQSNGIDATDVAAIGITNQRETTVVWNADTGEPIYNAIVWQDRRTASICQKMVADGLEEHVRKTTGLVIDAYFSGTKLHWILENVDGARELASSGKLRFGTIDSWLIWKLTAGAVHATDYSNASRTMLFDINELNWDQKLLDYFGVSESVLPEVRNSSGAFGTTSLFGSEIPITGVAGDQQAALFGQGCLQEGMAKNTYGTGCFLLMNTGSKKVDSRSGLLTTIAWGLDGRISYAIEGSVFIGGAAIQWLRDELGLIKDAAESEDLAQQVEDSGGVVVVPAFAGLGAPHWDMYARGTIVGLTRGSNKAHIVRATLESIAWQNKELVDAMESDTGISLSELRVDGGATANNFLMQFQADVLGANVLRPAMLESTAKGAAALAGIGVGFFEAEKLQDSNGDSKTFVASMDSDTREKNYATWKKAVDRSRSWAES